MTFLEFLASLATDTTLMYEFRQSPHQTLNRLGVTAEDQLTLLTGDPVASVRQSSQNSASPRELLHWHSSNQRASQTPS